MKKNSWTCHSEHFIFPSFLVLIRQEFQGFGGKFYGSWRQSGKKKNYSLGRPRRKLQNERNCSLLYAKCWVCLFILLRSPWRLVVCSCTLYTHTTMAVCFSMRLLPVALHHHSKHHVHLAKTNVKQSLAKNNFFIVKEYLYFYKVSITCLYWLESLIFFISFTKVPLSTLLRWWAGVLISLQHL